MGSPWTPPPGGGPLTFATPAEVTARTVDDKPIAPNTLPPLPPQQLSEPDSLAVFSLPQQNITAGQIITAANLVPHGDGWTKAAAGLGIQANQAFIPPHKPPYGTYGLIIYAVADDGLTQRSFIPWGPIGELTGTNTVTCTLPIYFSATSRCLLQWIEFNGQHRIFLKGRGTSFRPSTSIGLYPLSFA